MVEDNTDKDVHLCFTYFSKAFDNVKHEKLIEVLRNTGIDGKDIRIIANMYSSQTAKIKIGNSLSEMHSVTSLIQPSLLLKKSLEKHWRNYQMASKSMDKQH